MKDRRKFAKYKIGMQLSNSCTSLSLINEGGISCILKALYITATNTSMGSYSTRCSVCMERKCLNASNWRIFISHQLVWCYRTIIQWNRWWYAFPARMHMLKWLVFSYIWKILPDKFKSHHIHKKQSTPFNSQALYNKAFLEQYHVILGFLDTTDPNTKQKNSIVLHPGYVQGSSYTRTDVNFSN